MGAAAKKKKRLKRRIFEMKDFLIVLCKKYRKSSRMEGVFIRAFAFSSRGALQLFTLYYGENYFMKKRKAI